MRWPQQHLRDGTKKHGDLQVIVNSRRLLFKCKYLLSDISMMAKDANSNRRISYRILKS